MGSDRFFGDARNNVFYGGPGNDRCFGGDGSDTFYGDNDDDTFFGGNGYDTAFGYLGNDTLHGEAGADRLDGGPGDDKLWGEGGADTLYGGEGDDCLWAGAGPDLDRLYGENGFDTLVTLGGGADYAYGGDLDDRFWVDEAGVDVTDAGWWETDRGMVHRVSRFNNPVSFNASSEGVGSKELAGQNITNPRNTEDANGFHNYSNLPLFPAGGTSMDDVIQGKLGDCWIMAAISAMAKANGAAPIPPTDIIRNRMADMGDGTYAVKLGGSYYRVDADLPTRDGNPIYAGLGRSSSPSLWVPILEKAMVHHFADDYDDPVYYPEIEGGYAEDAFRALGMSDVTIDSGIDDGNELFNYLQDLLSSGHAVTLMTQPAIQGVSDKLVDLHVYTVDSVFVDADGHKRVRLRNPWGYDNNTGGYIDGPNDGYLTISAPTAYSSYWDIVSARVF